MNWFQQNHSDQLQQGCVCKDNAGIFLDKRQISRITALLLLIGIFIFIGGYFWGQRVATDQLLNVVERDSFADQIYYSMSSMYDLKDDESNEPDVVSGEDASADEALAKEEEGEQGPADAKGDEQRVVQDSSTYSSVTAGKKPSTGNKKEYFAQLVGFGYARPAQQLVDRLRTKGIAVSCQKRQSKSAQGKVVSWYQVVTSRFSEKKDLLAVVAKIKKHEKIHDVRVVEVGVS